MKIKISDASFLNRNQFIDVGRILYLTDDDIYTTAFGNPENMGIVMHTLAGIENGLFCKKNILVALDGENICSVLVGCKDNIWEAGTLAAAFKTNGLKPPQNYEDAEVRYFMEEAKNESGDYILCLAVAPEYRKKGIGRALLEHYLKDKKSASLECLEDNKNALMLYKSVGFVTQEVYLGYAKPNRPLIPVVKMTYKSQK